SPLVLSEWQRYLPTIKTIAALVVIDELPILEYNRKSIQQYNVRQALQHLMMYTNKRGRWYPLDEKVRELIAETFAHEFRFVTIAEENWVNEAEHSDDRYAVRLTDWLVDE